MSEENPRIGSTLESLLREDGIYEDAKNHAIKAVLAYKLTQAMKAQRLSKARMAERMETSRSQLDRLLDPENERVTLHTLKRAAAAVGMRLELELRQSSGGGFTVPCSRAEHSRTEILAGEALSLAGPLRRAR